VAPWALDRDEQRSLMRAIERAVVRDRALVVLLLFAALRISEAVALDLEDVRVSARKGTVVVRSSSKVHHNGCRDRRSRWPPPWSTLDISNADFDTLFMPPRNSRKAPEARQSSSKPRSARI